MLPAPFANLRDKVMEAPSRYNWPPDPDSIRITQKRERSIKKKFVSIKY
jgi:hypothetical protein